MRSPLLLALVALAAAVCLVSALSPPPAFEYKMPREYDKTNCEVCQAVIKQALRKIPVGAPDLSTQKLRRKREQLVSDTLEGICAVESFSRYEFSPPTYDEHTRTEAGRAAHDGELSVCWLLTLLSLCVAVCSAW